MPEDPNKPEVDAWIKDYVRREKTAMRGGQRRKRRPRVARDLRAAFPQLTFWQIAYYVIMILLML